MPEPTKVYSFFTKDRTNAGVGMSYGAKHMFNLERTPFHPSEAEKILCMNEKEIRSILDGRDFPKNIICVYRPRAGFNFSNIYDIFSVAALTLTFDGADSANTEDHILRFLDEMEFNVKCFIGNGFASNCGVIGEISEKVNVEPLCESMMRYAKLGEYYLKNPGILWDSSRREKIYACILVRLFHKAIPVFLSDDFGTRDSKTITIATSNVALVGNKAHPYLPLGELSPRVSANARPTLQIDNTHMRN